jgi:DNA polymerase-3 subunit gamma/tau
MGQDHVVRTLQNAIRTGKVSHAYLFCGTRGTGKTTTARLLAKALNCVNGPTPTPCNECPACKSVTEGTSMDIVEMDAASHRGVGDVKDIRENVKFPPMELRYKVFIIDEAHQLSSDAKDAFLKTLEEPPAHTVFVLATTEPQSIPITIRSRCQQFDFRRGSLKDIRDRLKYVTNAEGVEAEDAALDLMAMNADGSWRDSLSLLEQVLAYSESSITTEDVTTVLGTVTQDFLFKIVDTLADGNEAAAFEVAAEAVGSGKEIQTLLRSMAGHFRNLLFAAVTKNAADITTNEGTAVRLKEQAARFSKQTLFTSVEIFNEAERESRFTDQHRLLLELSLLKVIEASHEPAVQTAAPAAQPQPQAARPAPVAEKPRPRPETQAPVAPNVETKTVEKPAESEPKHPEPATHGQQHLPSLDKIVQKWPVVLQQVKTINVMAHGLLNSATPGEIRNGALVLCFQWEGQANILKEEKGDGGKRAAIQKALHRVFGVENVSIICEVAKPISKAEVPAPGDKDNLPDPFDPNASGASPAKPEDDGQETLNNVLDIFQGEIVS